MQEIEKELNRIRRIKARLSKQGETLTEEEAKLRESQNLSKHIKINFRMQMLNTLSANLEQQKRDRDSARNTQ